MSAFVPSFSVYVKVFSLLPTRVWVPVTSYVAPSPSAKPSPPTVTLLFVSALPSYTLLSSALVRVTVRLLISSVPSTITNSTLLKFLLVFVKSEAFSSMS